MKTRKFDPRKSIPIQTSYDEYKYSFWPRAIIVPELFITLAANTYPLILIVALCTGICCLYVCYIGGGGGRVREAGEKRAGSGREMQNANCYSGTS